MSDRQTGTVKWVQQGNTTDESMTLPKESASVDDETTDQDMMNDEGSNEEVVTDDNQ